jgi:hypothetical protein
VRGFRARSAAIRYEQAVYGSFPFWDKGYGVLAQSAGCRPEWIDELRTACQRFGERPREVAESEVRGLFTLPMVSGPRLIVGVSSPGSDDCGRPGALAFHALFVSLREYRRAGYDPFTLAGALRDDWTTMIRDLPSGTRTVTPAGSGPTSAPDDRHAARIATALAQGRRVALEAAAPIDVLARQVWRYLPAWLRRKVSAATWAFANGNRFDLVALPRLFSYTLDASYIPPSELVDVN